MTVSYNEYIGYELCIEIMMNILPISSPCLQAIKFTALLYNQYIGHKQCIKIITNSPLTPILHISAIAFMTPSYNKYTGYGLHIKIMKKLLPISPPCVQVIKFTVLLCN